MPNVRTLSRLVPIPAEASADALPPHPPPVAAPGGRRRPRRRRRRRRGWSRPSDGDDALVIYNGRSHYGDEQVFEDFEEATGIDVELRGGTGPELFERLRQEGDDTPADVLITTDLANLWRAEDAGLLQPVTPRRSRPTCPPALHDADGDVVGAHHPAAGPGGLHRAGRPRRR